ncbi:MAG TPA: histidine kinase [Tenacibaculum sp.]|nr:histidine kinase [Tenacibaculum sp.]
MEKLPDLSKFDEICNDDTDFKKQMISIIKKEFPVEYNLFEDSFELRNYKATAEVVHKLKHKINLLNLEDDYLVAVKFEKDLLNGTIELYDSFIDILIKIEQFLKKI